MIRQIFKHFLSKKQLKQKDLAESIGIQEQSLINKFNRHSFSVNDLIAAGEFFGCKLAYIDSDGEIVEIKKGEV